MREEDPSFRASPDLERALSLLHHHAFKPTELPADCPGLGIGELPALELLAPHVLGRASPLGDPLALAHMDPPTPWLSWAMALWNASLNQNLLHPATAPFAIEAEKRVISWLAPYFGMGGGHMCSGSTIANLTALWAARDAGLARKVLASDAAHLSVRKAARILGMAYQSVPVDAKGRINPQALGDLSDACLVLTAGTTATGVIDPLDLIGKAAWTHVDAAWAGPLRLSRRYSHVLDGIEKADSVAVSAHKWLFQPKDSALVFFREPDVANSAISFGGAYLATPNVGVQGSRGAAAIPLLATLIAWGIDGMAERIHRNMAMAESLADALGRENRLELWDKPTTAVTVFRPLKQQTELFLKRLPVGMLSSCDLDGHTWCRSVAANPLADIDLIVSSIVEAL